MQMWAWDKNLELCALPLDIEEHQGANRMCLYYKKKKKICGGKPEQMRGSRTGTLMILEHDEKNYPDSRKLRR